MTRHSEDQRIHREIYDLNSGSDPFAAAMRTTRMPMLITDPRQPDNPIIFVNDAFLKLTGYTRQETMGKNCRFLQGPGTNTEDVDKVKQAIQSVESIEIDLLNYRKDGSVFWNRLLVSPVFSNGTLTYFFASQLDVTREVTAGLGSESAKIDDSMQQRIADLTESEERLKFTLRAGGLGTWTLELANERLVASAICKANFGRSAAETFTYEDLKASIHPDDYDHWKNKVAEALSTDGELHVEYRAFWPDQSVHWIEIRAQTRFDSIGNPLRMSGVSIDVTQRKNDEQYRQLVTQEMAHRIKNILANVQSVVNQSLRSEKNINELRVDIDQRIQALARSQDVLTGNRLDVSQLNAVITKAMAPFDFQNRISITGEDIDVSNDVALAFTMAFHELATNAVKYGALSTDAGRVDVHWNISQGLFSLHWTEISGPPAFPPERTGFGTKLIERLLAAAVKGTVQLNYEPEGFSFSLRTELNKLR